MASKILNRKGAKTRMALAFAALSAVGACGQALVVTSANADTTHDKNDTINNDNAMTLKNGVTSGSFDVTKQAKGDMNFPVEFDRPTGVNASAIAGTVMQLGSDSTLYQSALKAVPDLGDAGKMNSLLSDALNSSSPNYNQARQDIVGLINWYNSLGGTNHITTQNGDAYTTQNLDQPINVLAVAFSNKNSINQQATSTLANVNASQNVGDVEKALEAYQSGVSQPYDSAFNDYANRVYAQGANINSLSQYSQLKPLLDAYQNMYANGASSIRKTLLNNQDESTEAGVTFFESAVISGQQNNNGGDSNTANTPNQKQTYNTRWVDENGNPLATPENNADSYGPQKDIPGYTYKTVTNSDNTKTYIYTKNTPAPTPAPKTADTKWVDENGNSLKPQTDGTYPDTKGDAIPGYTIVSTKTTTDADGNTHTVNTYKKLIKPNTYWFDTNGQTLKPEANEQTLPDTNGNAIPGYSLVHIYTLTANDVAPGGKFANSGFQIGDTVNVYQKTPTPTPKTVHTNWVDEQGNPLKPEADGAHPDNDGQSDIPGYTLISVTTDPDGNVKNVYQKTQSPDLQTSWVDNNGKSLAPDVTNTVFDNQKTFTGYHFVKTEMSPDGKHKIYVYAPDVQTSWVDSNGKSLAPDQTGDDFGNQKTFNGYHFVKTEMTPDGKHKIYVYAPNEPAPTNPPVEQKSIAVKPTATPSAKTLPATGVDNNTAKEASGIGFSILSALGLSGYAARRRKRKNSK